VAAVPPPAASPPAASPAPGAAPPVAAAAGTGRVAIVCLVVTLLFIAATVALFPRAYPLVAVDLALDRGGAIREARALAAAERLAPTGARAAAAFGRDDALATYVDLAAGGSDSVRALARGGAVPLYAWAVRLYTPGSADEVTLRFHPDGRPAGVARRLAEAERRPLVDEAVGRRAAEAALARFAPGVGGAAGTWRLAAASYRAQPRSGRVDRTYRFERLTAPAGAPLRVGAAPVRAEVTVTGDAGRPGAAAVLAVRAYADVPESWARRYGEMRSANNLLAGLATPAVLLFTVGAVGALVLGQRQGLVRWRPAAVVGAAVGLLMTAAGLNELPLQWVGYDTATSPTTFVATLALGAVAGGTVAGLWVAVTVAAAELLTRRAFPRQLDWYAYPRHAGAAPVAGRVLGGYALAAFGFLYVTLFYLGTRSALGWWVPTESLDDPNAIATPLPWVAAIGTSLFAGTWEEALFRAVPLALLSLWVGDRPTRRWWMAAGVVTTALAFGFGHANYPSWPAYSRGVELFAEAALWAVLYLRVGLPTTIIAHALYDLGWFGLFALHGRGPAYRTSAAVVLLTAALPALLVTLGWWRARAAAAAGAPPRLLPRLGDWRPAAPDGLPAPDGAPAWAGASAAGVEPRGGDGPALPASAATADRPPWVAAAAAGAGAAGAGAAGATSSGVGVAGVGVAGVGAGGMRAAPATARQRAAAAVVVVLGLAAALVAPGERAGPGYSAPRAAVARVADSALRARGVDPGRWSRTLVAGTLAHPVERRFLRDTAGRGPAAALARQLAGSYLIPAQWHVRYVRRHATLAERREEWHVLVFPDGRVRRVEHDVAEEAAGAAPAPDAARALARAGLIAGVAGPGVDATRIGEAEFRQEPRPGRLDTHVEYVDSATPLPGGATARVAVELAGAEPVRGERRLRLPDAWMRRDADRQSRRALAAALASLLVLGGLVALVVRGARRAPLLPPVVTRRRLVPVGVAAALVSLAGAVNGLPAALAGWASDTPWPTFVGETALAWVVGAVVSGLVAATLLAAWTRCAVGPACPSGLRPTPRPPIAGARWTTPCSSGRRSDSRPSRSACSRPSPRPGAGRPRRPPRSTRWRRGRRPRCGRCRGSSGPPRRHCRWRRSRRGCRRRGGASWRSPARGWSPVARRPRAVRRGGRSRSPPAWVGWRSRRWWCGPSAAAARWRGSWRHRRGPWRRRWPTPVRRRTAPTGSPACSGPRPGWPWSPRSTAGRRGAPRWSGPNARGGAADRPRPRVSRRPASGPRLPPALPGAAREERQAEVDPEARRLAVEPVAEVGLGAERDVGAVGDLDAHARADVRVVQVVADPPLVPLMPTNGRKYDTAARFATSVMSRAGRKW
jgi:membrane protease YdiL (CAAX protease family)